MNIFVAGHFGLVGSAIKRALSSCNTNNIITASRSSLDLLNQESVNRFFKENNIDQVYLAAAKVGGIHANFKYPAQFIYENLMIQSNIINAAHLTDVQQLLFLGSSCIYPKYAEQPMQESSLLTGTLEKTNEPYAIAKIAGIKMCESYNRQYGRDYRCIMPTNLYGPNDNFNSKNSHVIPALMNKFHDAVANNTKEVVIWGSGSPMREFLHVDDLAAASLHIMNLDAKIYLSNTEPMLSHINVGTGIDCTIRELAQIISKVTGFKGKFIFDSSKPDGTLRKLMDVSRINNLGWSSKISLEEGLTSTYSWYLENKKNLRY